MRRREPKIFGNRGMSLAELMVAITLGAILTAGVIQIFVSNKSTYEIVDDLSKLQENARFAMDFITRDLQMAGYVGCSDDLGTVTIHRTAAKPGGDLVTEDDRSFFPIEGFDPEKSTTRWYPSPSNELPPRNAPSGNSVTSNSNHCPDQVGGRCAGTSAAVAPDMILLRYIRGAFRKALDSATPSTGTTVTAIARSGDFAPNNFAAVFDCSSTDIFYITARTVAEHDADDPDDDTVTLTHTGQTLTRPYSAEQNATVSPVTMVRYYIGTGEPVVDVVGTAGPGGPSLFREVFLNGAFQSEELVPGVENMQIRYGVDSDGDGEPNQYLRAGDPGLVTQNDWEQLVSVRVGLLVRTEDEHGTDVDSETRTLNWTDIGAPSPNDRRRRRMFATTIYVRNKP